MGAPTLEWEADFRNRLVDDWSFEEGFHRNHEDQAYTREAGNVEVTEEGVLRIVARRTPDAFPARPEACPPADRTQHNGHEFCKHGGGWTSASLISKRCFAGCGVLEVEAKIEPLRGFWPAIWTTGDGPWPASGEIDLLEFYHAEAGAGEPVLKANTCHGADWMSTIWHATTTRLADLGPGFDFGAYHTWRLVRGPERLQIQLDGAVLYDRPWAALANPDGSRPFEPARGQHLRLNLAVGGDHGGAAAPELQGSAMSVRRVRYFSAAGAGAAGANSSAQPETIYIFRHAQSTVNGHPELNKMPGGHRDAPLTPLGREQAAIWQNVVQAWGVQRVLCSPLRRAINTACIIFNQVDCPIEVCRRLRERWWHNADGLGSSSPLLEEWLDLLAHHPLCSAAARRIVPGSVRKLRESHWSWDPSAEASGLASPQELDQRSDRALGTIRSSSGQILPDVLQGRERVVALVSHWGVVESVFGHSLGNAHAIKLTRAADGRWTTEKVRPPAEVPPPRPCPLCFEETQGTPAQAATSSRPRYGIKSVCSGKFLNLKGDGTGDFTNVQIWGDTHCAAKSNLWYIIQDGHNDTVGIQSAHSGKFLNLSAGGQEDGTNVQVWGNSVAAAGAHNQWRIVPLCSSGNNTVGIQSVHSGKFISVSNCGKQNSTNVHTWGECLQSVPSDEYDSRHLHNHWELIRVD